MNIKQGVRVLENSLGINLSAEQKKIIYYNIKSPVLVNACAGSGKTMLFLFNTLTLIITGQLKPNQIMGITFSKRAQLDMGRRYRNDLKHLKKSQVSFDYRHIPYFTTFHALFYRLLRRVGNYKNSRVIPSYQMISFKLSNLLPYPSKLETKNEDLRRLFRHCDRMINRGLTYDGLNALPYPRHILTSKDKLLLGLRKPQGKGEVYLYYNYRTVVKAYNDFKINHNYIDFTDMMVKLLKLVLNHHDALVKVRRILSQFKVVFIDEFQDINDIQWELIRLIFTKETLKHLVVIGDDDQSIYSFRGSNPNIILEYHNMHPTSKTFNLSTNYRTGGNILGVVKSLITQNHYRLPKSLLTGKKNHGKFAEIRSNNHRYNANTILMYHLLSQINNPRINDNSIAVLVHYNNSRMFVIDWLVSHGYNIKVNNSSYILQNNYIYKILMEIARSIFFNRLNGIYRYATRIGFRPFKAHIYKVLRFGREDDAISLSQYCQLANKYEEELSGKQIDAGSYTKDDSLRHYQHEIMWPNYRIKHHMGNFLWTAVNDLTNTYFKYMTKKNFMNTEMVKSIRIYLGQEFKMLRTRSDIIRFFQGEQDKIYNITHYRKVRNHPYIHIMSLHQSKGLQFKYVYLYGLNSRQDNEQEVKINHYFSPHSNIAKFTKFLVSTPISKINKISSQIKTNESRNALLDLVKDINKNLSNSPIKPTDFINKITRKDFDKTKSQKKLQRKIWSAYYNIVHISAFIEEQRRLIYVGITRAQYHLYLAYDNDADPLLRELNVPKVDKYFYEQNGRFMNSSQDHIYQRKLLIKNNKLISDKD